MSAAIDRSETMMTSDATMTGDTTSAFRATWDYSDRFVTVFDEMDVYRRMGEGGWELIGYGLVSRFRRPVDPAVRRVWQYHRVDGFMSMSEHLELEKTWTLIGGWMGIFHYWKRAD